MILHNGDKVHLEKTLGPSYLSPELLTHETLEATIIGDFNTQNEDQVKVQVENPKGPSPIWIFKVESENIWSIAQRRYKVTKKGETEMFKIPSQITVAYKMVVDTAEYPEYLHEGMTEEEFLSKTGDIGQAILDSAGLSITVDECQDNPDLVGKICPCEPEEE